MYVQFTSCVHRVQDPRRDYGSGDSKNTVHALINDTKVNVQENLNDESAI